MVEVQHLRGPNHLKPDLESIEKLYRAKCSEVDRLIWEIKEQVLQINPFQLLLNMHFHCLTRIRGKASEVDYDSEDILAFRMAEFTQDIIASCTPSASQMDYDEEEWENLRKKFKTLYDELYFMPLIDAMRGKAEEELSPSAGALKIQMQMEWVWLRVDLPQINGQVIC